MSTPGQRGRPAPRPEASHTEAARATRAHAARTRGDPPGCPMFPDIDRPNGAAGATCCTQGHLAGRLESAGRRPTRGEMAEIRHNVMHDGAARDIVTGMQDSTLSIPGGAPRPHEA